MSTPHARILARLNETTPLGQDIDRGYASGLRILKAYYNLAHLFGAFRIRFFRTPNGWHFEVEGVKTSLDIRRALGDCRGRLWFAELRGGDDVLFQNKRYPHERKWRKREEVVWREEREGRA